MFAEDNVTTPLRYQAVERKTDGDTNEHEELFWQHHTHHSAFSWSFWIAIKSGFGYG